MERRFLKRNSYTYLVGIQLTNINCSTPNLWGWTNPIVIKIKIKIKIKKRFTKKKKKKKKKKKGLKKKKKKKKKKHYPSTQVYDNEQITQNRTKLYNKNIYIYIKY